MIITIINVGAPQAVPGKKYSTIEVAYKDEQGRVQGRKLMSFSAPTVFNTVKNLVSGDKADVTLTKEGEYWNWTNIRKLEEGEAAPVATSAAPSKTESFAQSSTNRYETAEERAARQRLIVRQSSLSNAIDVLSVGAKAVKKEDVLTLAEEFTAWVFEKHYDDGTVDGLADDIPV